MNDLISRQDAIDACKSVADNINSPTDQQIGAEYCLDLIKEIPSVELEIKKGKWIENKYMYYYCSECGHEAYWGADYICQKLFDFCPYCGAKMEETK